MEIGVTNAALATGLAIGVWLVTRIWRQPVLVHVMWVLVLVKLVTPPMVTIPWPIISAPIGSFAQNAMELMHSKGATEIAPTSIQAPDEELTQLATAAGAPVAATATNEEPTPIVAPSQPNGRQIEAESSDGMSDSTTWLETAGILWLFGSAVFLTVTTVRLTRFQRALACMSQSDSALLAATVCA
jgi:hypothetical protein